MAFFYKKFLLLIFDIYSWINGLWKIKIRKLDERILGKTDGLARTPPNRGRAAIIAIYPSTSSVPFTINLLKALLDHNFFIILVSDRPVTESIREVLLPNCHQFVERAGVGADFASYKAGWKILTKNSQYFFSLDTLIIANDSLFYPKKINTTIRFMLEKNENWQCLFQGFQFAPHAQSYFLLFRKPVFTSKHFLDFWNKYRGQTARKHRIIRGEIALSSKLTRVGFHIHPHYSSTELVSRLIEIKNESMDLLHLAALSPNNCEAPASRETITNAISSVFTQNKTTKDGNNIEALRLIFRKFAYLILNQYENGNPTHVAGLLMNNLFGAPLKRDACFRGAYDIFQILHFASGYDEAELISMREDLSARALPVSSTGLKKLLIDSGRI